MKLKIFNFVNSVNGRQSSLHVFLTKFHFVIPRLFSKWFFSSSSWGLSIVLTIALNCMDSNLLYYKYSLFMIGISNFIICFQTSWISFDWFLIVFIRIQFVHSGTIPSRLSFHWEDLFFIWIESFDTFYNNHCSLIESWSV